MIVVEGLDSEIEKGTSIVLQNNIKGFQFIVLDIDEGIKDMLKDMLGGRDITMLQGITPITDELAQEIEYNTFEEVIHDDADEDDDIVEELKARQISDEELRLIIEFYTKESEQFDKMWGNNLDMIREERINHFYNNLDMIREEIQMIRNRFVVYDISETHKRVIETNISLVTPKSGQRVIQGSITSYAIRHGIVYMQANEDEGQIFDEADEDISEITKLLKRKNL